MREILFRAKHKEWDEWAEGDLIHEPFGDCIQFIKNECRSKIKVKPETVCQYTGLTDKNGRKIFEGDIITYEKRKFHVVWVGNIASFVSKPLEDVRICPCMNIGTMKASEVIGNIFDNPELLD